MTDTDETIDPTLQARLARRRFEPAGAGFAERIIAAARCRPQMPDARAWITELLAVARQPTPAFALAAMLFVGFVIGGAVPSVPGDEDTSLQNYLVYEGGNL